MKNTIIKKILILLAAILVLIQFIRPTKNESATNNNAADSASIKAPENIQALLQNSCYDCHSNNTNYPWYTHIQPIGLWMQHHVDEGKEELNFSIFNTYSAKRKKHKLEEIIEQVEEREMPLSSYTLIHKHTVLSAEQISSLKEWAKLEMDKIIVP